MIDIKTLTRYAFLFLTALYLSAGTSQKNAVDPGQLMSKYSKAYSLSRIYLQTDKSFYITGEIIWFKAHLLNDRFMPVPGQQRLLIEIWNSEKSVLQQQMISFNGKAHGSVYLPLYLGTGEYVLRAYTDHIADQSFLHFEKKIRIVNPFNEQAATSKKSNGYNLSLLPEGGQLVAGLPGRVGVKLTDSDGKPMDYHGYVLGEGKDTVSRFESQKFGLSSFGVVPFPGYTVSIITNDTILWLAFPEVKDQGVVMLSKASGTGYQVKIFRSPGAEMRSGRILVHSGTRLVRQQQVNFTGDSAALNISLEELGEGISRITLFDEKVRPRSESLLFKRPEKRLPLDVTMNLQEQSISPRSKIEIGLKSTPSADLSAVVFQLNDLTGDVESTILTQLWLKNDLHGHIDSAGYYFGPAIPERQKAIKNLLLTHGWRGFKWPQLSGALKTPSEILPGQAIRVKVIDKKNNEPVRGKTLFLTVPGKSFQFYSAKTDSSGVATVIADRLYGTAKILLVMEEAASGDFEFLISTPFSAESPQATIQPLFISESYREALQELSLNMQVQNIYAKEDIANLKPADFTDLSFYGKADESYLLDEYTRFPTMEEVLREYVREVQVRREDDTYRLRMFFEAQNRFFFNEPLRLIDGIPVYDSKEIIDFDPLSIEKLEVIDQRFVLGSYFSDGVISFTTFKGDADPAELNPNAFITRYEGLQPEREFYSPDYGQSTKERVPDFRTLLHWDPMVKLNENGEGKIEFFSGDRTGKYVLYIEGMDDQGLPAIYQQTFTITEDPKM